MILQKSCKKIINLYKKIFFRFMAVKNPDYSKLSAIMFYIEFKYLFIKGKIAKSVSHC